VETVTVLLWAAAREAAGTARLQVAPGPLQALLDGLAQDHPRLTALLPRCRISVDGELVQPSALEVAGGSVVEVLPPYAGG
jgi:molybdopterin synthase sulfur carrier subunit